VVSFQTGTCFHVVHARHLVLRGLIFAIVQPNVFYIYIFYIIYFFIKMFLIKNIYRVVHKKNLLSLIVFFLDHPVYAFPTTESHQQKTSLC